MNSVRLSHFIIYLTVLLSATDSYRTAVLSFNARQHILKKQDRGLNTSPSDSPNPNRAKSEKRKIHGVMLTLGNTHRERRLTDKKNGGYERFENQSGEDEQLVPEVADVHDEFSVSQDSPELEHMKDELENKDDHDKFRKINKWTEMMKSRGLSEWQGQCMMVRTHLATLPDYDPAKDGWGDTLKGLIGKGSVKFVGKRPITNRQIMMTMVEDLYEHKRHQVHGKIVKEKIKIVKNFAEQFKEFVTDVKENKQGCADLPDPIFFNMIKVFMQLRDNFFFIKHQEVKELTKEEMDCFATIDGNDMTPVVKSFKDLLEMEYSIDTDTIMKIAENPWLEFDTEKLNIKMLQKMAKPKMTLNPESLFDTQANEDEDTNFTKFVDDQFDSDETYNVLFKKLTRLKKLKYENKNSFEELAEFEYVLDLGNTRKQESMHRKKKGIFKSTQTDDTDSLTGVDIIYENLTDNTHELDHLKNLNGAVLVQEQEFNNTSKLNDSRTFVIHGSVPQISPFLSNSSDALYSKLKQFTDHGHERSAVRSVVQNIELPDVTDMSTSETQWDGREGVFGLFVDEHGPVDMQKVHDLDEDEAELLALRQVTSRMNVQKIGFVKNRLTGLWRKVGRRGYHSFESQSPTSSEEIEDLMGSNLQHFIGDIDSVSNVSTHYEDDDDELTNFKVPSEIAKYLPETMKGETENGILYFKKYEDEKDRELKKHYYPIYKRIRRKVIKKRYLEDPDYYSGKSMLVDFEEEDNSQIQQTVEMMRLTETTSTKAKKVLKKAWSKINPVHIYKIKKRTRITKKLEKILQAEFFHSNTNKELEFSSFPEQAFKMGIFDLEAANMYNEYFKEDETDETESQDPHPNPGYVKKMYKKDEIETIFNMEYAVSGSLLEGQFAFGDKVYSKLPMMLKVSNGLLDKEYLKQYGYQNKKFVNYLADRGVVQQKVLEMDGQFKNEDRFKEKIANEKIKREDSNSTGAMDITPYNESVSQDTRSVSDIDEDKLQMQVLEEPPVLLDEGVGLGVVRFEDMSDQLDGHNQIDSNPIRAQDEDLSILDPSRSIPEKDPSVNTNEEVRGSVFIDDIDPIIVIEKDLNPLKKLKKKLGFNNPIDDFVNFYEDEDDEYFMDELSPDRGVMRYRYDTLKHSAHGEKYNHVFSKDVDMRRKDLGLKKEMSNETEKELLRLMEQKFETEKDFLGLELQGLQNKFNLFQNYGFELRKEMSSGLVAKLKDMKQKYYGEYLAESEIPEELENKEIKLKRDQLQQLANYDEHVKRSIKDLELELKGLKTELEIQIQELKESRFEERIAEIEFLDRQREILEEGTHLETYDVGNIQDSTISDKLVAFFKLKISMYKKKILDRNIYLMEEILRIKEEEERVLEREYQEVSAMKALEKNYLAGQKKALNKLRTWRLVSKSKKWARNMFSGRRRRYDIEVEEISEDDDPSGNLLLPPQRLQRVPPEEINLDDGRIGKETQEEEKLKLEDKIDFTLLQVQHWREEKIKKKEKKDNMKEWLEKLNALINRAQDARKSSEKKANKTRKIIVSKYNSQIKMLEKSHSNRLDTSQYKKLFLTTQNKMRELREFLDQKKGISDLMRALKQYLSVRDPQSETPQYEFLISTYEMEELEARYEILGDFMNERFFNNRENDKYMQEMLVKSGYQEMTKNNRKGSDFEKRDNYETEMRAKIDFDALEERGYPVPEQSWDTLDRLRTLQPPKKKKYATFSEMFHNFIKTKFVDSNFNIFSSMGAVLKYEERPNLDNVRSVRYFWDDHKYHPDLNKFVSFPLSPLYQNPLLDLREFSFGNLYYENFNREEMAGQLRAINTPSGFGKNNLQKGSEGLYKDGMQDQTGLSMFKMIYENIGANIQKKKENGQISDFTPRLLTYPMSDVVNFYNQNKELYHGIDQNNQTNGLKFCLDFEIEKLVLENEPMVRACDGVELKRSIRHNEIQPDDGNRQDLDFIEIKPHNEDHILGLVNSTSESLGLETEQYSASKYGDLQEIMDNEDEEKPVFINGSIKEKDSFDWNLMFMMSTNSMMWNVNVKSWAFILGDPKYRFPEHQNLVKYISKTLDHKINTIYKESRERLELARNILALERVVDIHGGFLLAQSYMEKKADGSHMRCFLDTQLAYQIFTMIKTNVILNEVDFIESFLKTLYNLGHAKDAKSFMMLNYSMFASPEYTTSFANKELPDPESFQEMGVAIERFSMHYSLMINAYKDLTQYASDNEQKKKKKEVFVNLFYKIKRVLLTKIKEKFRQKMQENKQNIQIAIVEFIVEYLVDALSFLDFVPFFETVVKKVVTLIVGKLMEMIIKKLKIPIAKGIRKIREIFNKVDNINMHNGFVNSLDFEKLITNQIDYTILSNRTKFKVGADSIELETIFYENATNDKLLYNQMQNLYLFKPTKDLADDVFNAVNIITKEIAPVARWDGVSPLKEKYGIDVDFKMTQFESYSGTVYYKNMEDEVKGPSFLG